MIDIKNGCFK